MENMRRLFIVGCARSGTTLLQRLLAGHPEVQTFRESHFFPRTHPIGIRRLFQIPAGSAEENIRRFMSDIGCESTEMIIPSVFRGYSYWAKWFISLLDQRTQDEGKGMWIEKTPMHLHYIRDIERTGYSIRFIHLLRNGIDTTASLYHVTQTYPEFWGGERTPEECARRWAGDVKISVSYIRKPTHLLVRYENIISDSEGELRRICRFLDIEFSPSMLDYSRLLNEDFILPEEEWKKGALEKITARRGAHFPFDSKDESLIRPIIDPTQNMLDNLSPVWTEPVVDSGK